MDYRFFDPMMDAIFVLDSEKRIVYSNEAASTFCETSQRRLAKKEPIYEIVSFDEPSLFLMPQGEWGKDEATSYREVNFSLKSGKAGKVQLAIYPFIDDSGESRWVVLLRDVTLEEILVGKYKAEIEAKEAYISQLQKAQAELESYSKNLESMVAERTSKLREANRILTAIMESLGQGFLVFGSDGKVLEIFTKACLAILETDPGGKSIKDILRLEGVDRTQFEMWCQAVFSETLPFDSLVELAPRRYQHTKGRDIFLDYYALEKSGDESLQLVLVATDRTLEMESARALEQEKEHAQMILKIVRDRHQFSQFLHHLKVTIDFLAHQIKESSTRSFDSVEAFRKLHTIEGEASAFSAIEMRDACRECQDKLTPLRMLEDGENSDALLLAYRQTVDLLVNRYRDFMQQFEEIFKILSVDGDPKIDIEKEDLRSLLLKLKSSGVGQNELLPYYDRYFKRSIREELAHFDDIIQLIANKQGKLVSPLIFEGEDVRIYTENYRDLFESFIHVFRNAVDHGLEESSLRVNQGKSQEGKIQVNTKSFVHDRHRWIKIEIFDDGSGISPEVIREKIKGTFPNMNVEQLASDDEIIQFIFQPGFTTRDLPGEFSGRGIGMDAVKAEVERLGGWVKVSSKMGEGTKVTICVPEQGIGEKLLLSA